MNLDDHDLFTQLKVSLRLDLDAIFGGVAWALLLVDVHSTIDGLTLLPEIVRGAAKGYLLITSHRLMFTGAALWSEKHRNDYETQVGRAMSKQRQYLQVGLRGLSISVALGVLLPRSHWLDTPLKFWGSHPAWPLWLAYRVLLGCLIIVLTPDTTMSYVGPSMIPTFADILIRPLQVATKWRQRRLAATFVTPSDGLPVLPEYIYQPTGQDKFRILKLARTRNGIRATLEEVAPGSCPPYWAVSYVWGSAERTHRLQMSTTEGTESYLRITTSCARVLSTLTPFSESRYLWIDAICINQDDPSDKVTQIPLMAPIYSGAAQVVGCLFPREILFLLYLDQTFMHEVLQFPRATPAGPKHILPIYWWFRNWTALVGLFQDPYWSRAWIIQEICLAKKLVFLVNDYYTSFTWDQFYPAMKNLYALIQLDNVSNVKAFAFIHPAFTTLITQMSDRLDMLEDLKAEILPGSRENWPVLADVVDRLYTAQSTNPRDQIFAFLGLASDGQAPQLRPNYDEQGMSHSEMLCKIAIYFLEQGHIHFFLLAGLASAYEGCDRPVPNLPSWVPILPKPKRPRLGNRAAKRAKASICRLTYRVSEDARELSVRGVIVDEIAAVVVNPVVTDTPEPTSNGEESAGVGREEQGGASNLQRRLAQVPADFITDLFSKLPLFLLNIMLRAALHGPSRGGPTTQGMPSDEDLVADFLSSLFMCDAREDVFVHFPGIESIFTAVLALLLDFAGPADQMAANAVINMVRLMTLLKTTLDGLDVGNYVSSYLGRDGGDNGLLHWVAYHFSFTTAGRMAWVPQGAQVGDRVCFLDGLEVPILLRPAPGVYSEAEEEERFELVGDCWVQRLGPQDGSLERRWLKIV